MRHKYASAHEWLLSKVTEAESAGDARTLAGYLRSIVSGLDGDEIQDSFQSEMDADGYFEDLDERPEGACFRVEYDPRYYGGDYSGSGEAAYVSCREYDKLRAVGVDESPAVRTLFKKATGIDPVHIVHYNVDEQFTEDGDPFEEE